MARDFYATLGVPRNATANQIRERFLDLTREMHPDRFQGSDKEDAEQAFQEITQAFNVLSDPSRRREHDIELSRPKAQQGAPDTQQEAAKAYLQRGVRAYKAKNFPEAADAFDRATKAEPHNSKAWHYLALACSQNRKWYSRAMVAAARACELEPMKASYLKVAGRIHAQAGAQEKAKSFYKQAVQWGGEDPEIEAALAELEDGKKKGKSRLSGLFGRIDR
jgi:curved DNA-binding protein CbpA